MSTVTVYPTKASALHLKHPHGHPMAAAGVTWPNDGWTGRRLVEKAITKDAALAWKPEPGEAGEPVEAARPEVAAEIEPRHGEPDHLGHDD